MNVIYNKGDYYAQIVNGACVVHRVTKGVRGVVMSVHCGEKHESQDWREVTLHGCPNEIRVEIVQAYKDQLTRTAT